MYVYCVTPYVIVIFVVVVVGVVVIFTGVFVDIALVDAQELVDVTVGEVGVAATRPPQQLQGGDVQQARLVDPAHPL